MFLPRGTRSYGVVLSGLMPALVLALTFGCARAPVEHTARKIRAESAPEKPAAENAEKSQPDAEAKSKAEFETELSAGLDEIDAEIQRLKAKAASLEAEARAKLDKAVSELDTKHEAARSKLRELRKATAKAWEHLKQGTKAAREELEQAVKRVAKDL